MLEGWYKRAVQSHLRRASVGLHSNQAGATQTLAFSRFGYIFCLVKIKTQYPHWASAHKTGQPCSKLCYFKTTVDTHLDSTKAELDKPSWSDLRGR